MTDTPLSAQSEWFMCPECHSPYDGQEPCCSEEAIVLTGWAARWAEAVVRARETEAERDRYRAALEEIAQLETVSAADRAVNVAGRVARAALDQKQASDG